jgi:stage II sporulation protein D
MFPLDPFVHFRGHSSRFVMARNAERPSRDAFSPPTSRRSFLRAAAVMAATLAVGCSKKSAKRGESSADVDSAVPVEPDAIPRVPDAEPTVRVRLRSMGPAEAIEIGPPQQWLRIAAPNEERTLAVLRGPLRLSRRNGAWSLVDGRGFTPWMSDAETLSIAPLREPQPVVHIDAKPFPGTIQLHARLDRHADAFDLVNHVQLENYLPGVLVRELYNHWHIETHTAQAIAARTFATTEAAFWRSRRHFDLTNTEASQMYTGMTTHETSLEAVRATRGVMLAYHNQLVPGYYSASCGGLAAKAVDAISANSINDVPPLEGHDGEDACASLAQHRWRVTHAMNTLAQRFRDYGKAYSLKPLAELDAIRKIDLIESNEHGRPTLFAIDTGSELLDVGAERLRWAANFTEAPLGASERLLSSYVEPIAHESRIKFHGRGRGHGAGMCQYGAESMARSGKVAIEILKYYYPGIEVVGSYT